VARFGRAVAREGTRERRLLVVQVVLQLFPIELDEDLALLHAIAQIR
jgi:hypothetical protein